MASSRCGSPASAPGITRARRVLRRGPDGRFWLVTPVEQGLIEVEDAPFVAVELRAEGAGDSQLISLRTNLDEWVTLDDGHPLAMRPQREGGSAPYVRVRDSLDARVSRPTFYHLVELAEPAADGVEEVIGVRSAGRFFPLGPIGD